ncbi:hypothetical protein SISSUDRAFT_1120658 [Sistotremastrum suecicum HHB10207 ss-3]|uniref:Uncharacterized protein n=1 Tax=Sistotremastrum suecicum HHB10207 ss-3 TaxID=1314776 RepID=A0A166BZZ9_9AGAM|nr:hypothetical protein SISSUDRAFT_1120658 [Sistotremastrum suecicum HHB10207 ss-3]
MYFFSTTSSRSPEFRLSEWEYKRTRAIRFYHGTLQEERIALGFRIFGFSFRGRSRTRFSVVMRNTKTHYLVTTLGLTISSQRKEHFVVAWYAFLSEDLNDLCPVPEETYMPRRRLPSLSRKLCPVNGVISGDSSRLEPSHYCETSFAQDASRLSVAHRLVLGMMPQPLDLSWANKSSARV